MWRPLYGLSHQPQMIDDDDDDDNGAFAAIGGMIERGNRSTRRKPASLPLGPPQIPYGLTLPRTRAASEGMQRLTYDQLIRLLTV
jgi:hypothetical protein